MEFQHPILLEEFTVLVVQVDWIINLIKSQLLLMLFCHYIMLSVLCNLTHDATYWMSLNVGTLTPRHVTLYILERHCLTSITQLVINNSSYTSYK